MFALLNLDGTTHVPNRDEAYVRVRLTEPVRGTGAVTVYLPSGTALVVPGCDLVTVAPSDPPR
jgi:hypothetical protein